MASLRLVPASVRDSLLGIPSDVGSLERNYVLPDKDLDLISTRRRPDNRLGLAGHIAPLVAWLAEQVDVSSEALARYAARGPTRSEHRRLAIRHLSLRAFMRAEHMRNDVSLPGLQSRHGSYQWRTLHWRWWVVTGWLLKSI